MAMKNPAHLGRVFLHSTLEPMGLSIADAARALGIRRNRLSEIAKGRSRVTPEIAIRIEKAFGEDSDAGFWYRMQGAWDLAQAERTADQIKVERCAKAD